MAKAAAVQNGSVAKVVTLAVGLVASIALAVFGYGIHRIDLQGDNLDRHRLLDGHPAVIERERALSQKVDRINLKVDKIANDVTELLRRTP